MKWNLFSKVLDRSEKDFPVQPTVMYLDGSVGVQVITFNDVMAAHLAMRHPIVYRALDKIASSVQQISWFAMPDDSKRSKERAGTRAVAEVQELLDSPNGEMTPAMLRYWLALTYASYGRVPVKVGHKITGSRAANGIYPLEARYVDVFRNRRGIAERYEYGHTEEKEVYPSRQAWERNRDSNGFIDQIWRPGLRGLQHRDDCNTPLNAINLPAQVIRELLQRAIKSAQGHPNIRYLVTCSKTLTDGQLKALRNHLNTEHATRGELSGSIPILQNAAEIEIHKLDNDLSDIHTKMPSDDMARLIFGAFGIPIALAGVSSADSAKFASNYTESRKAFWQDTIIPVYVEPLFQGLTKMICPPGVIIAPDYDSVPALMTGRITSMQEADAVTFLTINEKRAMFGWEAIPDGDRINTNVEGNQPRPTGASNDDET